MIDSSTTMEIIDRPHAPRRRRSSSQVRTRPRSLSTYPTSNPSAALGAAALARSLTGFPSPLPPSLITAATGTVESLDLPTSLPALLASLKAFLLGHVAQVEDRLRLLSEDLESSSASDEDDEALLDMLDNVLGDEGSRAAGTSTRRAKGKARELIAPVATQTPETSSSPASQFVDRVRAYLLSLKADLFSIDHYPLERKLELSPSTSAKLAAAAAAAATANSAGRPRTASFPSADSRPERPKLAWLGRSRSHSPISSPSLLSTPVLSSSPFSLSPPLTPAADSPDFCPSPSPLDEALAAPTVPSTFAIPDGRHLLAKLSAHSEKIQNLLAQVSLYCRTRSLPPPLNLATSITTIAPADDDTSLSSSTAPIVFASAARRLYARVPSFTMPSRPPLPSPAVALSSYFSAESDRLAQLVAAAAASDPLHHLAERSESVRTTLRAYRDEARTVLAEGEERLREEGERLKGWVDAEAEKFKAALRAGKDRLLNYQELPIDWRNNEYILSGYRFIPAERWRDLLASGFQWHNETVNIHTHLIGSLSMLYLLLAIWPSSPFSGTAMAPAGNGATPAATGATTGDRLVALAFVVCAFKCLVCSSAWHLFGAGCASIASFNRFACVDYVGISGLIAASVISTEYYGFYCRRELAYAYMTFSALMGVLGVVAPFKAWFDGPRGKTVRVCFFVSMACSSIVPALHMSALYGVAETARFFRPIIPSIMCYLGGLFFYVTNYPERFRPGGIFDHLFSSHQWWHVAILGAIWLHWHAICSFHRDGRSQFSCARPDDHLWDKVLGLFAPGSGLAPSSPPKAANAVLGWMVAHL